MMHTNVVSRHLTSVYLLLCFVLLCVVSSLQVMPGLLLCFVLRYDAYKRSQPTSDVGVPAPPSVYQKVTYFHCSLIGYFLGKMLICTLNISVNNVDDVG